jgi:glycopeptide antibiotics resistance protein
VSRAAVASAALALAVVVGAFLVFQPSAATSSGAIVWLSRNIADLGVPYHRASDVVGFSLNVALFVPGAAAAALLWRRVRWWQWVLVGFVVSAGIETMQGLFFASRDAEVRDLVSNTLGAALGSGAVLLWRQGRPHT